MKKVLIVDDEKDIREIFEDLLKSDMGIDEVTCAADGLDAYMICSSHKFDMIILDHMMPFMKGADFLVAVRNKEGPNKETPIVMISAFLPDLSETIRSMNNTFFLDKPADMARVSAYVKMLIK